jgi:hypothetical protein
LSELRAGCGFYPRARARQRFHDRTFERVERRDRRRRERGCMRRLRSAFDRGGICGQNDFGEHAPKAQPRVECKRRALHHARESKRT